MKKTKLLSLVLAATICVSLFVGCGSKEEAQTQEGQKKNVVLHMWGGVPPEYGPQEVVDNFNKEFKDKGITVEYTRFVNDDQGNLKLDTALLSGGDIDLYMTYAMDALKKRSSGNMALDLSKFIEADKFDMNKRFGTMVKNYYVNDKPYSVPEQMQAYALLINKDMFDAAGIPVPTSWTYDEYKEIAKKLTKGEGQDKVYGAFLNTVQSPTYGCSFLGNTIGGDPLYKQGGKESNFDDIAFEKNLQLTTDMMNVDKTAVSHVDTATQKLTIEGMFLSGKAAMSIGAWAVRSVKDTAKYPHTFKTAFAPYPTMDKGPAKYTVGGYGDFLCINPKSKNTKEAWEFIKWYTDKGALPMAKYGRIPASKDFDKAAILKTATEGAEKLLDTKSFDEVLVKSQDNYAVPSITNKIAEITKISNEEFEAAYTKQKTPKAAMESAKKRADALLK